MCERCRHCEPTGRRQAPPDDRLREAIQKAPEEGRDCFVATLLAMTTWIGVAFTEHYRIAAFGVALSAIIVSISRTTSSGAAYCTIWPTPGSTISFAFGTVAANRRE
jgi:hypothetical protein